MAGWLRQERSMVRRWLSLPEHWDLIPRAPGYVLRTAAGRDMWFPPLIGMSESGRSATRQSARSLGRRNNLIAPGLTPMDTSTQEYARLRAAVTGALNAHDVFGVLPHGAPEDEYEPEMGGFARLMGDGVAITPEVVAAVWHHGFGDSRGDTTTDLEPATPAMEVLAADLAIIQGSANHT